MTTAGLRIGYFLAPYPEGGLGRHVLALVDHIAARHSVTVFCESGGRTFHEALKQRGIATRIVDNYPKQTQGLLRPALAQWVPLRQAHAAFRKEALDVVHFHAGRVGALYPAIVASRLAGIPARLLTVHNPVLARSPGQRFFEARALGSLDRIVAVCDEVKRGLMQNKHAAPEKIAVIVNGVDPAEFDLPEEPSRVRAELGIDAGATVIGAVGRLQHYKGIDVLIRAAALLRERWPTLRLLLVGSGPDEGGLKELAAKEGLADIVHFAGYRPDARRLMRAMDIVALPSRSEALPFTLLEAMAARKPVVAASVGSIPSVLLDHVTGLLFPAENVAALTQALEKLLNDPAGRSAMGQAARQRVERDYTQSAMVEKTAALYEEARRKSARE